MGHKDVRTTMIYLHVIEQTGYNIQSPLDRPDPDEEYSGDAHARPFAPETLQWDLAARQWPKSPGAEGRERSTQHAPAKHRGEQPSASTPRPESGPERRDM
ncbi:MAG: hypothetical protein WEE89_18555 [Gemmatimonadota bacterium]